MAASHGHKHAFLCLHSLCKLGEGYAYSRRNDGETILHCAISGDYFDLAFQIIHRYEKLVNSVNERGFLPLHLLAAKPSAFRSGSHLGRWNEFIYHLMHRATDCTFDNQGKPLASEAEDCPPQYSFDNEGNPIPISDAENPCEGGEDDVSNSMFKAQGHQLFPPNYSVCFELVKLVSKAILVILGLGSNKIRKIREKKQNNTRSIQVMNELLKRASMYEYLDDENKPQSSPSQPEDDSHDETKPYVIDADGNITFVKEYNQQLTSIVSGANQQDQKDAKDSQDKNQKDKKESPILIAAKNGITEIVEKILEKFPVAWHDRNYQKKNVVLLAVENRQIHVYQLLLRMNENSAFRHVDHEGNSALHLAAKLGEVNSWLIPGGAAMLMQWEIKWYEFVTNSKPRDFFVPYNKENKSPKDVFTETHKALVKEGGEWLYKTSESCSVVATLITTVAFAASTTVPGGVKGESGKPTLENQHAFMVFAISSLVAFSFSVTAVIMFLAIITTWYQERDFRKDLPRKLLIGITSLFVSLASMLISFFAGHFFILRDKLNYITVVLYVVMCLPVAFFTIGQFPLYFDVVLVTFSKVPRRSYKPTNPLLSIHE
ncbi:hypothetical protein Q3G72_012179 [Acer saccharum]|nr:hypothetical protein Q3G72_012179 [Acer saccharum]